VCGVMITLSICHSGWPVGNGSIILLHFTTFSVTNVSALIDNLNKRGFELVTVSQLFASTP